MTSNEHDPIGPTGNFGRLADDYEKGRKDHPSRLIRELSDELGDNDFSLVLDIGCGTGRSTRDLASRNRFVIGVDIDHRCIEMARGIGGRNIAYQEGSASKLHFPNRTFDAVFAICSFHWWHSQPGALHSVFRVLRPGGKFIVVNKDDVGSFRNEVLAILETYCSQPLPASVKEGYDPHGILTRHGGWRVNHTQWEHVDEHTLPELITHIRSMSPWNAVSHARREEVGQALENHFRPLLADGIYRRRLTIKTVIATKIS